MVDERHHGSPAGSLIIYNTMGRELVFKRIKVGLDLVQFLIWKNYKVECMESRSCRKALFVFKDNSMECFLCI